MKRVTMIVARFILLWQERAFCYLSRRMAT